MTERDTTPHDDAKLWLVTLSKRMDTKVHIWVLNISAPSEQAARTMALGGKQVVFDTVQIKEVGGVVVLSGRYGLITREQLHININ